MSIDERMARIGTRAKHRFVFDGQSYAVASSGFAAIFTSQPVAGVYLDAPRDRAEAYGEMLKYETPQQTSGEVLRAFAGPIVPEPPVCDECKGDGSIECGECGHERDCKACDATGNEGAVPNRRQVAVKIAGMLVSRHLLAEALAETADTAYRLGAHARENGSCLVIRGDNWTGVLMGLNPTTSPDPVGEFTEVSP